MDKPRNKDIYDDIVYEIQKLILKGITSTTPLCSSCTHDQS